MGGKIWLDAREAISNYGGNKGCMEVIREAWGLQGRHKGKRIRREGGMWQESREARDDWRPVGN